MRWRTRVVIAPVLGLLGLLGLKVLALGGGVPGRNRKPQHVGEASAVAVGDGTREDADLGSEHRQRRHHRLKSAEPTLVICGCSTFENEAINELTCEANSNPGPRNSMGVLRFSDAVVEQAIEMRQ